MLILATGLIRLIEAVPDLREVLLRDADAGVLYGDEDLLATYPGADRDRGFRITELQRVIDQVIEHLLDLTVVRVDHLLLLGEGQLEDELLLLTGHLEARADVTNHAVHIEVRPAEEALLIQGAQTQH